MRSEIVEKIRKFNSFLDGSQLQREFHRSVIKNGKKFVVLIDNDCLKFIPGHYAIAPQEQLNKCDQKQTVSVKQVENNLCKLCGTALSPDMPLYQVIDDAYVSYCEKSADTPSAHKQQRSYWIIRP